MKVAIIGSAPSSAPLAPYEDPEWTIWGCSPGAVQYAKRVDAWFELHRWGQDWLTKDYRAFLAGLGKPVYMLEAIEEIPTSVAYPVDDMTAVHGRAWFTSTPAWMIAMAITRGAETIGLFGIDMAADDEYLHQKPGLLRFIEKAQEKGIEVVVPPESDLMRTPPLYGIDEANPMLIKLQARREELLGRIANADSKIDQFTREKLYLSGAEDNLRYIMQTWVQ